MTTAIDEAVLAAAVGDDAPRGDASFAAVALDGQRNEVRVDGRSARLTPAQARLLGLLLERAGSVVPTPWLLPALYPGQPGAAARARLRTAIRRLRRRIETDPRRPRLLLTGPGATGGYVLRVRPAATVRGATAAPAVPPTVWARLAPRDACLLAALRAAPNGTADWRTLAAALGAPTPPRPSDRGRVKGGVLRTRRALAADPAGALRIVTLRGAGYALTLVE